MIATKKKYNIAKDTIQELIKTNNRYRYICEYLKDRNIEFNIQKYNSLFGIGKNIEVGINNNSTESVLISAHYDDNGIYDNCGGVLQLLLLCEELSFFNNSFCNYVLIFTDQEECFQQGIYHYIKNNVKTKFKYHLNIDGLGIGTELILFNSLDGHIVVDWLNIQEKVILLTDNSPFTGLNINSLHLFSCFESEAKEITRTQNLHKGFQNYFNEEWCKLNFNIEFFEDVYSSKILNFLVVCKDDYSLSCKFTIL